MEYSASSAQTQLISPPAAVPLDDERKSFRIPAWLVSLVLHVAAILVLALIPLASKLDIPFIVSGTLGTNEEPVPFEISNMDSNALVESSELLQPALNVESMVKIESTLNEVVESKMAGVLAANSNADPSLSGRSGSVKSALLAAYGGTEGTEKAVEDGLVWLVRQQRADGSWSLKGPYSGGGISENKSAATAMALLALAGAGNSHISGNYSTQVKRGLDFLIRIQDADGFFATGAPEHQQMYGQAQCTIAICELYGMTGDRTLRAAAQRAIDFAENSQSYEGGWRYQPREDSDTSVTGWFLMALMSGRMAGLSTNKKVVEGVDRFLDSVQYAGGSEYAYTPLSRPSLTMTAEALLCREYLGWQRDDVRLIRGCEELTKELIQSDSRQRYYYYWYYATQTLHHFGGDAWQQWNKAMRVELPRMQVKDGKDRGSWPPQNDEHSSSGGRLFSTCVSLYCLEVYYRHLPLYGLPSK
ncbi:MAG: prenyltransferase/squalene oxidase repeat-containing protein [Pirellulaceae bacterium]|nr:prenyltransferase/squalene oxidase repeat-containing protein [Pirellulaceae bacterium]